MINEETVQIFMDMIDISKHPSVTSATFIERPSSYVMLLSRLCRAERSTFYCFSPEYNRSISFGTAVTRAKEVWELSIMLYGNWAESPPTWLPQYKCMEIFNTFAFIGVSTWNLQRSLKMELFTLRQNFVQKSLIQIFDDVIANYE